MKSDRASITATKVGRVMLYVSHHPELSRVLPPGVGEANERLMMESGLAAPWMLKIYESTWWESMLAWIEEHTIPGQTLEYACRKRYFDDEVRAALAAGAEQVLVLGAGLDTLCARLAPEHPAASFFEVDHPATQANKTATLEKLGWCWPNLHLTAADLGERDLDDVLAELPGFRRGARTVVVAEALLMYLDEADVVGLLERLGRWLGEGSRFLFTFMHTDEAGEIWLGKSPRLMKKSMEAIGEPLRWAVAHERLGPLLAEHGLDRKSVV